MFGAFDRKRGWTMKPVQGKSITALLRARMKTVMLLLADVACALGLSACTTCVGGNVSMFDVPLSGVLVQLFDENSNLVDIRYTDYLGNYCFEKVRLDATMKIRAVLDEFGNSLSVPVHTSTTPGFCKHGPCTTAPDITFSCDLDSSEPNNSCGVATSVTLPYTNRFATLCPPGDVDFYRFDVAETNMAVVAETFYAGTGSSFYSRVGVFDADCNLLSWQTGTEASKYAKIAYTLPGPGTYYVAVTGRYDWDFQGNHSAFGAYGLDIHLTHASCVNAYVTSAGEPVEQAWVYSSSTDQYCQTDRNGTCCLDAFEGIEAQYTICHPETWQCVEIATTPQLHGRCDLGLCEELAFDFDYTCVSGIVTREGSPIEGAWVAGYFGNLSTSTETDAQGGFCLIASADSQGFVSVQDPLFWNVWEGVQVFTGSGGRCGLGGCTEVEVELPGITCVSGSVTRDGYPEQGIWISSSSGDAVSTDIDGAYCLQAPKDTHVCISVYDPITDEIQDKCLTTGDTGSCDLGDCSHLDFELEPVACIHGTVTRQGEVPAEGVQVCAYPGECVGTGPDGYYCLKARTDTYAQVFVYDPACGNYWDAYAQTDGQGSCLEGTCIELNFQGLPSVACTSGIITRAGVPERGVSVCSSPGGCTKTDEDGKYCLAIPAFSDYYLYTTDPVLQDYYSHYGSPVPEGSCSTGNCATNNFTFDPATCISGVVREGTEPLKGAIVINETGSTETDKNGYYCLGARPNSSSPVYVYHPRDGSLIIRYPRTGTGGSCEQGGCTTQNFTFDVKRVSPASID